jgi:hypothetical protein
MFDQTSLEIVQDCLARLRAGDTNASFDLASSFMSHADSKNVDLHLAIVEALATISKDAGSKEAAAFLQDQWPDLQASFRKRWLRAGFVDIAAPGS